MAVTNGNIITPSSNYSYLFVVWAQQSQSVENNSTTIAWSAGINISNGAYWGTNSIRIDNVYINGTKVMNNTTTGNISGNGDHVLGSGTITIPHNSDGTKTFSMSLSGWLIGAGTLTASNSFELTPIPRKTSITSFSVSKRSETTFTFNWATADTVDYVWYSINNGTNWTGYDVTDGTSGNFTVSGLTPNTTYNCKLRVRRKDSQLTTDSGTVAQTTYAAPTQSFKSKTETSITMNWSVDSTANYIWYSKDNGSNWTAVGAVNATSGSYTISGLTANTSYNIKTRVRRSLASTTYDTSASSQKTYQYPYVDTVQTANLTVGGSQKVTLYNPLSRSVTVYMKQNNTSGTTLYSGTTSGTSLTFTPNATTLYNSIPNTTSGSAVYYCVYSNQTVTTKSGTYTIDNSQGQHNPTFSLSNWSYTANLTNLTNNNQVVINNKSTVTFSIDTAATAKDGSSIDYYLFEWGTVNKKSTDGNTIANGNGNLLKVTAFDKRGYYTPTTLNLDTNYIDYKNITYSTSTAREDGVDANTTLKITGTLFHQNFGSSGTLNQFTSAKYYTSTNNSTWSTAYTIPVSNITYNNNYYTLNNYQIHANGSSGGFTVGTRYYVKIDLTDSLSTVTFTTTVTDGKIAVDTYQDSNGDYHRGINGLADSNYALKVYGSTYSNGQLFRNAGSSWIGDRDAAVVRNNNTTQGGAYYPVVSQKTKDGNWTIGQLSGENNLTFNYTTDTNYNNKNNVSSRWTINTSGLFSGKAATAGTADSCSGNAANVTQKVTATSKTHTNYNNNQGYVPAMSFLTFWNGAYNSSNNSNLTYAHQGTIQCKPTNLYNNATGTNGTITLSQTAANFTFFTITIYNTDDKYYSTFMIYAPNGRRISMIAGTKNTSVNQFFIVNISRNISGTSMTKPYDSGGIAATVGSNASGFSYDNVNIVRVDGWK